MNLQTVLSGIHFAAVDAQVSLLRLAEVANERLHLGGMVIIVAQRLSLHPVCIDRRVLAAPPWRGGYR